jgi:FKBP-type peptidyl-prolyl cis-trans isomerase
LEAKISVFQSIAIFLTFSMSLMSMISCNQSAKRSDTMQTIGMMDDTLLNYNQQVVQNERQAIEDFIMRYQWKMKTTSTGLWYMIYKNGKGPSAKKGDIVSIFYSVHLLNGELVFKTDSVIPFKFEIGKGKVPNGLEEGVMLMKPGDKAKLIVPSHLAFGLAGDMDKIPNRAILLYDVEMGQQNRPK